jgi:hypothetical protein
LARAIIWRRSFSAGPRRRLATRMAARRRAPERSAPRHPAARNSRIGGLRERSLPARRPQSQGHVLCPRARPPGPR